ncbi:hypothetical protein TG4357_00285 [Thalassovita gelatinovora]|uniref:DUF4167 domain-containing protein n=1 Tax=Thalassovita gelatinovora TaxID=53501 RepID=A0A0P1F4M4_THAGE|nr:DUF4167 domain-containing protein [Thalassovita gelatinovora]QIZ79413.1 DUF4167 domain-containing protein [Thalassovita gelatinovora]CUH62758.1 hypothetical protein TG4357_00285 [Thalassovita gelatinovora]SEQ09667.1 protein of unknown function [Thalassovita gelatinovora]
MRSSKSRSRSKSNRNNNNRNVGNIVNRVFDSSGPEGKVRGTPQQIIEKYNQLARDAQLSNDRVAAENFQQHAEHYLRMLSAAQRDMDARREQQERENRERQAERDRDRAVRQDRDTADAANKPAEVASDPGSADQPDIVDLGNEPDSGLVETPEAGSEKPAKPKPARKPRKPRVKKPVEGEATDKPKDPPAPEAPEAAE